MKNHLKVLILLILIQNVIKAQTGLWLKIGAEKKITKKLELELNFQPRFNTIDWPASSYIGEAGLKYDLPKGFTIGLFYRYIKSLKNEQYQPYHRYYVDLSYKFKKASPIIIDYRLRFQQQFKDDDVGLVSDKNYWRNKLELAYKNKSKFEPFVSTDLFYKNGYAFDQVRYKAGMNYKITKNQSTEISILADDALNSSKATKWRVAVNWKIKL
ncbi:MAG: DUF2490 domain-containing protein [Bacteroidota bacterium]